MMEVYRLEKMILEEQREKQEILVAVNESLDSHREIQMILNITDITLATVYLTCTL